MKKFLSSTSGIILSSILFVGGLFVTIEYDNLKESYRQEYGPWSAAEAIAKNIENNPQDWAEEKVLVEKFVTPHFIIPFYYEYFIVNKKCGIKLKVTSSEYFTYATMVEPDTMVFNTDASIINQAWRNFVVEPKEKAVWEAGQAKRDSIDRIEEAKEAKIVNKIELCYDSK